MAAVMSAKRPRALTNGVDAVGGMAHNGRTKRLRHATPEDEASSDDEQPGVDSDSEDDEEADGRDYEQMIWATQQVQRDFRATANKQNTATDSGIIEEIQCINFMCHEHLTVTLGPLINFIIGHNGSGKSAVLTALTISLGGKATATNRAQNLKSLIKEGKDHCSVQVRIKNQGALAYKPSQYGDSITVERHFNRSGTSGFKLKDQNGRIVSTKKAELEDILDAFSLQIDNPMNVLTQDKARSFLNDSTPKDKYKFFLSGTQLETLSRDYQQIEQCLELMHTRAEVKRDDIAILRKQMEDLAAKARRAESLEKMRAREAVLAHQALWANVEEEEQVLADADRELEKVQRVIEKRQGLVEEASEVFERSDTAFEAAKQDVTDFTAQVEPAKQESEQLKGTFDECRKKLFALNTDQRDAGEVVKLKRNNVARYKSDIEDLRQLQAEADNGQHAEKLQELEDAKIAMEMAKQRFSAHGTEPPTLQSNLRTAEQHRQLADQKAQKARDEESRLRGSINRLRGGQHNWIEGYMRPQNLHQLLRAIESDQRFHEQPVGPIGRHVKLLKPEWGNILEKQFGASLNAFVVTSRADQSTLSGLMRRCNWEAPIYIGKNNHIDTTANEPDPSLLTWMRALTINSDLVRNQFIINQTIEQTVLIESHREGYQLMSDRGPRARNVKMCFTFAEDDTRKGRVINYSPSGGINDSPIDEYRGVSRMQVDKDDQIRQEETRLDAARREVQDLDHAVTEAMNQLNACQTALRDHTKEHKRLKLAYQKASDDVGRLDEELSNATPDAAAIDVLQDALVAAEKELNNANGMFEDIVIQKDALATENRANKTNLEAAQRKVADLDFKLGKAQTTVRKLQGQREDNLKKKNDAIGLVEGAERNKAVWEEHRRTAQVVVDEAVAKAEQTCQRVAVPSDKDSKMLGDLLEKLLETRRKTEKELGGSQDELLRKANDAKKVHQEARREFEDIESVKSHLNTTLTHRRERWQQFRSGISVRARVTFNYLLSERKFRGTLSIDHKKQLLDIHVQPDITERSGDGRQTKTLSGGEKSYSTVCLLLALWDAMGSPIRCLDEFDVFMDSVNRERSMEMIIQAARRSIGRQFIFITPQAMNNVKHTSDVKIIRMSDPERNQTALNFGQ
ncbi:dna repair protein-like protein rad18 [Ophiobolus disseminans]|uniref:Dna repair protein-like protein rad18 n=1 Tax=Ophiobolus disseminans TaxID=1469910 RepID=A0A6A7A3F1_9PLEO|nr:dna repair protein-like protein rad18 [Ophiobolus disseminans]